MVPVELDILTDLFTSYQWWEFWHCYPSILRKTCFSLLRWNFESHWRHKDDSYFIAIRFLYLLKRCNLMQLDLVIWILLYSIRFVKYMFRFILYRYCHKTILYRGMCLNKGWFVFIAGFCFSFFIEFYNHIF